MIEGFVDPWDTYGEPPPEDDALAVLLYEVCCGRRPWSDFWEAAGQPHLHHDTRPLPHAQAPIADDLLADLVEQLVPDVGLLAPDRVLGPYADEGLPPRARTVAGSVLAFSPLLSQDTTPLRRFQRVRPKPPPAVRASLRAVAAAPPMAWALEDGHATPLLPLAEACTPDSPLLDAPSAPAAVARAVPHADGWRLLSCVPLPAVPPADVLLRRMRAELALELRLEPQRTWEDLLRRRAEVLYRTACEWCWIEDLQLPWP